MSNKKKNIKNNNLIQIMLGLIIIILINIIGSYIHARFDLTTEKRYSLSDATKQMLNELDDIVYFRVYLQGGDFPAGFKKLRNETKEILDEFRAYNDLIQYEFINPSESVNAKERNDTYKLLIERGLQPTDLQVKTNEGQTQKIIFPGALVSYKSRELPLELLRTQMGVPPEAVLNNSIQSLEFNIASIIRKLTITNKSKIAFIKGHGELDKYETADINSALSKDFVVERIELNGQLKSLTERSSIDSVNTMIKNKFDAIIIAKPQKPFSDKDKFIIDQFVMRGGKVLWLIDPVFASMDSIQNTSSTISINNDLNLTDQLFNYGIRLKHNLIMDLNALPIPLRTGQIGGQPQIDFFPWYFFPILTPISDHPIVNNLNAIKTEFISSIDTLRVEGIKKTILLKTSPYSKLVSSPAMISLSILQDEPDQRMYNSSGQPVAVLLEGEFESVFKNRIPPLIANDDEIGFREKSKQTKMVVISDGDIIRNQLQIPNGYPLPLGYDQFTRQTFGNKELILNVMSYLCDGSGLISIRSRELKLRLLDRTKVNNNKLFWQMFNIILPVLLILIFGIVQARIRKAKYSKSLTNK